MANVTVHQSEGKTMRPGSISRRIIVVIIASLVLMLGVNPGAAYAATPQHSGYVASIGTNQPERLDRWNFYTYYCTSYAAYRVNSAGTQWRSNGNAHAYQWDERAQERGIGVGKSPKIGAVAVWERANWNGWYGHVAYVESVDRDGTANISEYNAKYKFGYSVRKNIRADKYIYFKPSASQYKGSIVHWSGDTKPQKTAWFVGSDGKRRWIASTSVYSCLKSIGAPGPKALSSGTLNKLPDLTGRKATCPKPSKTTTKNTLKAGQGLVQGAQITSRNGKCRLVHQGDGNTVIYHNPTRRALWATYRWSGFVVFQADGNFVGYTQLVKPTWSSQTNGKGGTRLVMQNDCNLVVYNNANKPVWASWTVV